MLPIKSPKVAQPELPPQEKEKPSVEILLRTLKEKGISLPLIQKKYLSYMTDLDLKSRVDQQFGSFGNWLLHSGKPTKAKGIPRLTQLKHKIGETDMKKEDYDMEESTQYPSGKPEYPDVVKEDEECAGMDEDYVEETTKFPSNKGKYPDTYLKTKVREHKISMSEWFNIGEGKKKSDKKKDKKPAKSKKKSKKIDEARRKYKYNTPEEFLSDYSMGVQINPRKDLHPDVLDFARSHRWDISKMKDTLYKKLYPPIQNNRPAGQIDAFDINPWIKK